MDSGIVAPYSARWEFLPARKTTNGFCSGSSPLKVVHRVNPENSLHCTFPKIPSDLTHSSPRKSAPPAPLRTSTAQSSVALAATPAFHRPHWSSLDAGGTCLPWKPKERQTSNRCVPTSKSFQVWSNKRSTDELWTKYRNSAPIHNIWMIWMSSKRVPTRSTGGSFHPATDPSRHGSRRAWLMEKTHWLFLRICWK